MNSLKYFSLLSFLFFGVLKGTPIYSTIPLGATSVTTNGGLAVWNDPSYGQWKQAVKFSVSETSILTSVDLGIWQAVGSPLSSQVTVSVFSDGGVVPAQLLAFSIIDNVPAYVSAGIPLSSALFTSGLSLEGGLSYWIGVSPTNVATGFGWAQTPSALIDRANSTNLDIDGGWGSIGTNIAPYFSVNGAIQSVPEEASCFTTLLALGCLVSIARYRMRISA